MSTVDVGEHINTATVCPVSPVVTLLLGAGNIRLYMLGLLLTCSAHVIRLTTTITIIVVVVTSRLIELLSSQGYMRAEPHLRSPCRLLLSNLMWTGDGHVVNVTQHIIRARMASG